MKTFLHCLACAVLALAGIGCEMHPASRTVKSHADASAPHDAKQEKALEAEPANPKAPSYFQNH